MTHFCRRALFACWMLGIGVLVLPNTAVGQGAITADRPGFGDGASVLAPRTVQIGAGAVAATDDFGANGEIGQVLLRVGVTEFLEVRGGVGSAAIDAPDLEYTGTSLGAKLRLVQQPTSTVSLVSSWSLPTGSGAFTSDVVAQTLKLAVDGALGEDLTLSVNGGATVPYDDGDPVYQLIPTLTIAVNETVGAYVGYAGFYADGPNANFVETGVTLLSSLDTQLDLNTGLQIDDNGDAFFIGAGIAHRF
jgi:hypothetical protein